MKKLTKEQTNIIVNIIIDANERVKGTPDYYKYLMQCEWHSPRVNRYTGKSYFTWHFVGHSYPTYIHENDDVLIYKKSHDQEYLYYGDERYMLDDTVKNLIKNCYDIYQKEEN